MTPEERAPEWFQATAAGWCAGKGLTPRQQSDLADLLAHVYGEGREAERERCAEIAEDTTIGLAGFAESERMEFAVKNMLKLRAAIVAAIREGGAMKASERADKVFDLWLGHRWSENPDNVGLWAAVVGAIEAAERAAKEAPAAPAYRVKPLEWRELFPGLWAAGTPLGNVLVCSQSSGGANWYVHDSPLMHAPSTESARQAAESYYLSRLLPALESVDEREADRRRIAELEGQLAVARSEAATWREAAHKAMRGEPMRWPPSEGDGDG